MNATTRMEPADSIMERQTIRAMCLAYQDGMAEIDKAFALLAQADDRLRAAFGGNAGLLYMKHGRDEVVKSSTKGAWWYIIQQTRVLEMCSIKQRKQIEDQLERDELPQITEANVWALLEKLRKDLPEMLQQSVAEVYRILRPGACQWDLYKTNAKDKWEVGSKLILSGYVETGYGHARVNHYREQDIRAIDNVFHLLDSKGVAKYPDDLVTTIDGALTKGESRCETEYFRCKMFPVTGTLHLEIKRDDLRKELNRIAGGLNLADETAAPHGSMVQVG